MPLRCTTHEFIAACIGITEPQAGNKVRGFGFVGVEVTIQRQQDKDILLGATPMPFGAMRQEAIDHFRDQVSSVGCLPLIHPAGWHPCDDRS